MAETKSEMCHKISSAKCTFPLVSEKELYERVEGGMLILIWFNCSFLKRP